MSKGIFLKKTIMVRIEVSGANSQGDFIKYEYKRIERLK